MTVSVQADTDGLARSREKNVTKLVVATSLGNALEWFDISVYAYFAAISPGRSFRPMTRRRPCC
jgi:MHS family proline/betaine transporter-like MFS transporter